MEEVKQQATETTLTLMDKLENVANALLDKLIEVSPQALDTILSIRRLEGLAELVPALILLVFFLVSSVILWKQVPKSKKKADEAGMYEDSPTLLFIGNVIALIAGMVLVLANLRIILNFWNWVAIFAPELSIAKDIMDGVLGK